MTQKIDSSDNFAESTLSLEKCEEYFKATSGVDRWEAKQQRVNVTIGALSKHQPIPVTEGSARRRKR